VFYPVGAAANYGLFYVLIRAAIELPIQQVLELGAGQSSILLDSLWKAGVMKGKILTVEHDDAWAELFSGAVSHSIAKTDLVPKIVSGVSFIGYDFTAVDSTGIELLIVDGPPAAAYEDRYSRLAAIELVTRLNFAKFIVIVDDAEREGERLLVREMEAQLKGIDVDFRIGEVRSTKRQVILAGGQYKNAAFY
jgi:hypothetical protein